MQRYLSLKHQKLIGFVLIVASTILISCFLLLSQLFEELENRSWDWRLKEVARHSVADSRVKIIVIDQSSLQFLAEEENQYWPWPRERYVPIIEFLKIAKAKAVALDILFTEQSHYSVEDDAALAKSISAQLPFVSAMTLGKAESNIQSERLEEFRSKQLKTNEVSRFSDKFQLLSVIQAKSITLPILEIIRASHSLGNVSIANDSDGVFRHFVAGQFLGDIPILTLPFALFNAANSQIIQTAVPVNKNNQFTLRFAGPSNTYKTYSFVSILKSFQQIQAGQKPLFSPDEFKDSYVFIGMNAPGLLDLRPTPLDPTFPGVEVNATALDNLLNNSFIREAGLTENILYSSLFICLLAFATLFIKDNKIQISIILLSFISLLASSYYAAICGVWIQLLVPVLSSFIAVLSSVALQYKLEGSQSRFIKKAFRYYVSPEVIEKIIEDPSILALGGDRKELTIFFCDIVGFTSISETMDPANLVIFLNKFLSEMTSIILSHGGTVDKYVGDAIVAFWNAPISDPDHASRALQASIACQKKLNQMQPELLQQYGHTIELRIGVHTGIASVGNFGSHERFNYTTIGDAANLASRLEGANKSFGTDILLSESTYSQIKNFLPCLRVAVIKVMGKNQSIAVYTPNQNLSEDQLEIWNRAVDLFEQAKLIEAQEQFNILPGSRLKDFYLLRISENLQSSNQPDWTEVFSLHEK